MLVSVNREDKSLPRGASRETFKSFRFSTLTAQRLEWLSKQWESPQTTVLDQLLKKAVEEEDLEVGDREAIKA
jgi:hypothetical protein